MEITKEELKQKLGSVKIIDVRESEEFAQGHIPNAVNIPLGAFIRDLKQKGEEMLKKDEEVVIYCATGGRSSFAVIACENKGWTKARNLIGGYFGWDVA